MTEEDATSYVKKVIFFDLLAFVDEKNTFNLKRAFFRWYLKTTRLRLPFRRLLPRTSCFLTWTKEKGGQYETYIALYHMIHLKINVEKVAFHRKFSFFSDIFDAMCLVKHNAGETVIQQGMKEAM